MLSRQNRFFRLTAFVTLWLVLGTIMPGWALVSPAVAQGAGDLGRARDHVDFAEYEQALGILDPLIASGSLSGVSLRDAYVLKARSHIGLGNGSDRTNHSGVVEHAVEPAETGDGSVDRGGHIGLDRHVDRDETGRVADLGSEGLAALDLEVGDDAYRTLLDEPADGAFANSTGAAGDNRDFSFEPT
jgi:hypothetical protein